MARAGFDVAKDFDWLKDWKNVDWLMLLSIFMLTGLSIGAMRGIGLKESTADGTGFLSGFAYWAYFRSRSMTGKTAAGLMFGAVLLASILSAIGGLLMSRETAEERSAAVTMAALVAALAWKKDLLSDLETGEPLENRPSPEKEEPVPQWEPQAAEPSRPARYKEAVFFLGLPEDDFTRTELIAAYRRFISSAKNSGDPRLAVSMANEYLAEIERVRRNEPGWKGGLT